MRFELPKRLLAMLLAFAAGGLITALTFEFFHDSTAAASDPRSLERVGGATAVVGAGPLSGSDPEIVLSLTLARLSRAGAHARRWRPRVAGGVAWVPKHALAILATPDS